MFSRSSDLPRSPTVYRGELLYEVVGIIAFYHLVLLLAVLPYFFSWTGVIVAGLGAYITAGGIGIGYHRLLAHQSFACSKVVERILVVLALLCVQRGPVWWVATHRRHHHFADSQEDPHSPRPSILWAHMGWFLFKNENTDESILQRYAKDLLEDPFYAWIETSYGWFWIILSSWIIYFIAGFLAVAISGGGLSEAVRFGLSLVVWGVFVRTVYVWHLTWATASCTHRFGYRNCDTPDESRNNWVLGLLAAGEGWGNNHHAFPRSPRYGLKWWEIDTSWLIIRLLASARLVKVNPSVLPAKKKQIPDRL